MMGCLYQIEFPNGKSYIGITSKTAEARFKEHCKEAKGRRGWPLHRALNKHGIGNARVKTLVIADDWNYLCGLERRAIEVFGTFHLGYNATHGGDGFAGEHTAEAKAKIGRASRNCSAETRKKIGDAFRGRTGSNRGCKHSAEAKARKALRQLTAGTPSAKNTSGVKGVYFNKMAKKWQAYFKTEGKFHYLGLFVSIEAAARARAVAVADYLEEVRNV